MDTSSPDYYNNQLTNVAPWFYIVDVSESIFFDTYLVLSIVSVGVLLSRAESSKASRRLVIFVIALCGCTTLSFILSRSNIVIQLKLLPADIEFAIPTLNFAAQVTSLPKLLAGDAILVWRTLHLCLGRPLLRIILLVSLTLDIVSAVSWRVLSMITVFSKFKDIKSVVNWFGPMFVFTSLGVNLCSLTITGILARQHGRRVRDSGLTSTSSSLQILYLMLECGVVLAIIQIAACVTRFVSPQGDTDDPAFIAGTVVMSFFFYSSASYPSIIIILVALDKSAFDDTMQLGVISKHSAFSNRNITALFLLRFCSIVLLRLQQTNSVLSKRVDFGVLEGAPEAGDVILGGGIHGSWKK